jgi:hypothetical protein
MPAGKYSLRVLDSPSDRHIVQFMNDRQTHVFVAVGPSTIIGCSPPGETAFTFCEMPRGQPEALRAWFYPGDNFGQGFIYPKGVFNQAQTAQTQTQTVAQAEPTAPAPEPPAAELAPAPAPEPAPEVAQNEPAPAPAPVKQPAPQALPQTASDMPLFALFGLLPVGAAFSVRALAKRIN